jgi:DNA-binding CsgD family transcriptional regulator
MLANAYNALGQFDRAKDYLERSNAHLRKAKNSPDLVFILRGLGMAARFQGRPEEAAKFLNQCLEIMQSGEIPHPQPLAGLVGNLAFVEIELGHYQAAWNLVSQSCRAFLELHIPGGVAWNIECFAFLALAIGQPEVAARFFGSGAAARDFAKHSMLLNDRPIYAQKMAILKKSLPPAILETRWAEGRALSLEEAVSAAERFFESMDLGRLALTHPPELVKISAAAPAKVTKEQPTQAVHLSGLTARELEVLRLVARGLTNAQVAQELVLSPLTVNAYLRSIYSKLNVTSRTAAARLALENGLV